MKYVSVFSCYVRWWTSQPHDYQPEAQRVAAAEQPPGSARHPRAPHEAR
jgi:hypothetical protein